MENGRYGVWLPFARQAADFLEKRLGVAHVEGCL
jgi:hypothetical protein